jgi:hypothetical protein
MRLGQDGEAPSYAAPEVFRSFEAEAWLPARKAPATATSADSREVVDWGWKAVLKALTWVADRAAYWVMLAITAAVTAGLLAYFAGRPGGFPGGVHYGLMAGLVYLLFVAAMAIPSVYAARNPDLLYPDRGVGGKVLTAMGVGSEVFHAGLALFAPVAVALAVKYGTLHAILLVELLGVVLGGGVFVWAHRRDRWCQWGQAVERIPGGEPARRMAAVIESRSREIRRLQRSGWNAEDGNDLRVPCLKAGAVVDPRRFGRERLLEGILLGLAVVTREVGMVLLVGFMGRTDETVWIVRDGMVYEANGILGEAGLEAVLEPGAVVRDPMHSIGEVYVRADRGGAALDVGVEGLMMTVPVGGVSRGDWRIRSAQEKLAMSTPASGQISLPFEGNWGFFL